ncbi:MAG: response regulator [Pirellulales bacterium]
MSHSAAKILIADDDLISREMLERTLLAQGYDVTAVDDGDEALRLLKTGEFRLVVVDWDLPGVDGLELIRAARAGDIPGYVYVILITGRDKNASTILGLEAGADDFVAKPFEPSEMIVRIRSGERVLSLETRDVAIFALARFGRIARSRDRYAPRTRSAVLPHLGRILGRAAALRA